MLPPWAMITPWAPASGTTISAVTECDLFLMLTIDCSLRRVMPPKRPLPIAVDQHRPAGEFGHEPLGGAIVEREDVVLGRLDSRCSSCNFSGCCAEMSSNWVQSTERRELD
jgi:hypothetical protein